MPSAVVNANTAATHEIIPAPGAHKWIVVLGYVLVCEQINVLTWRQGATAISGPMAFGDNGGVAAAPATADGWFRLPANTALNLTLSSAQQVGGHVLYAIKGRDGA